MGRQYCRICAAETKHTFGICQNEHTKKQLDHYNLVMENMEFYSEENQEKRRQEKRRLAREAEEKNND